MTWLAAGGTLFVCYLHVSRMSAVSSDGASNVLQAWDMLHHNLLLRGWQLSDVSFYTTELPQYMVIEYLRGLTPDVVHIASAMTYTMVVLLAALLAKGRATGREAITASLIAVGIMASPQVGNGVYVLMGSPDHMGTAVPVLAAFVLLDRAPRRWYVPVALCAVLTAGLIADGAAIFTGVAPVIAVGLVRCYLAGFVRQQRHMPWFDLSLVSAAALAVVVATVALRQIASHGGFRVWPVSLMLASAGDMPRYTAVAGRSLLLLFGANFLGHAVGLVAGLAAVHLVGLALAVWGTCAAIRRWVGADLAVALLAAGVVCTLAAYLFGTRADSVLDARDITAVLPFGSALAGRMLAGRLARARLLPVLTLVLAAYLISLGRLVTHPPAQQVSPVASWLVAHGLDDGLSGYWDANITTVATGGRVRLRSVLADGTQLTGDYWEVRTDWYDPAVATANFIVLVPGPPGFRRYPTVASVRHTFGQPLRIYYLNGYTIMVWNKNLLADLAGGAPPAPRIPAYGPAGTPIPAPPGE